MIDPVRNLIKIPVIGTYDADDTVIRVSTVNILKLPDPDTEGNYNLVWYNDSDYPDPSEDDDVEIVRVTSYSIGTGELTISRAQENTIATAKAVSHKTYKLLLAPTKKTIDDIRDSTTLLFSLIGADMNTTDDQLMDSIVSGSTFIITDIIIKNASIGLLSVDNAQFWSDELKSGDQYGIVYANSIMKLTSNNKFISLPQEISALGGSAGSFFNNIVGDSVFFSLGTPQGEEATADILLYGHKID